MNFKIFKFAFYKDKGGKIEEDTKNYRCSLIGQKYGMWGISEGVGTNFRWRSMSQKKDVNKCFLKWKHGTRKMIGVS